MLETKNLVKVYKPKKGLPVVALDDVSITFPEKGMVFLLGKSGSGKSTLLNVLGGLDNYNKGEIIIKGVSSKDFKQKHFDSYRNTYVGFIFQEYNVLDDFSVGANIALAIELQNRKATDVEINNILKRVDLEGFGNRKPNELSGGQKQRVAIARALVKNPEIIMADEPTGALDSVTGKQVLSTLKELSREKLVIVVSHDREFAETYGDRIIELADGKIIRDVERCEIVSEASKNGITFGENTIEIKPDYHLTDADRTAILEYIESLQKGIVKIDVTAVFGSKFTKTNTERIKKQDGSSFKLIKSKLPLRNAFKIGAGALKYKKFRLVMTILLSCISFGLFGLADTFGAYNHVKTCTNSLYDTGFTYVSTAKSKKVQSGDYSYWRDYGYLLSQSDLDSFKSNTSVKLHPVYVPLDAELSFEGNIDTSVKTTETDYSIFSTYMSGFALINEGIMEDMSFKLLAGALPDGSKNEIAVSEYIFEVFKKVKYTDGKEKLKFTEIISYGDLLGKELTLGGTKYTVTAIIDTNFDLERYLPLAVKKEHTTKAETLLNYVLFEEFNSASSYSYSKLIMTGEGYIDKLVANRPFMSEITEGYISFSTENSFGVDSSYLSRLSDVKNHKITWLDGEKTSLGEKEIIVTRNSVHFWSDGDVYNDEEEYKKTLKNEKLDAYIDVFGSDSKRENDYRIVGILEENENEVLPSTVVCHDGLFEKFVDVGDNFYKFAVGVMPKEKDDIEKMVSYCYREDSNVRNQIQNSVTWELDAVNETLQELSKIFLYIGIGFAVFASLMLANFIGISISYKKQEIGILRAIGSRSNDVFRIFFAESFIIAMINFLLSAIGVGVATAVINYILRTQVGILITVLNFGARQTALLLAVSVVVAFIASFIPVKRIASKRPIDAIRNR